MKVPLLKVEVPQGSTYRLVEVPGGLLVLKFTAAVGVFTWAYSPTAGSLGSSAIVKVSGPFRGIPSGSQQGSQQQQQQGSQQGSQ